MRESESPKKAGRTIRDYKSARRRIDVIKWPGTTDDVGLLYLTCGEQQKAYFAAREYFDRRQQPIDHAAAVQFELEWKYQLCHLMLVDPECGSEKQRIFSKADEVRHWLTPNEAAWFVNSHEEEEEKEEAEWTDRPLSKEIKEIAACLGLDPETPPDRVADKAAELVIALERSRSAN